MRKTVAAESKLYIYDGMKGTFLLFNALPLSKVTLILLL